MQQQVIHVARITALGGVDTQPVMAEVYGPLAVYGGVLQYRGSYVVTHLPTGWALMPGSVPNLSRARARRIVKALGRFDWRFKKPTSRKWTAIEPHVQRVIERTT